MGWNRIMTAVIAIVIVNDQASAQSVRVNTATPPMTPRVVFVCEHGTVKSLVAVDLFNRLAAARGLHADVSSRGTRPDSQVPLVVQHGLAADGFDVRTFRAQLFTRRDLAPGTLVIALDADVDSVVAGRATVVHWDGLPSVLADYAGARTAIGSRVRRLVDSLAAITSGRRAP